MRNDLQLDHVQQTNAALTFTPSDHKHNRGLKLIGKQLHTLNMLHRQVVMGIGQAQLFSLVLQSVATDVDAIAENLGGEDVLAVGADGEIQQPDVLLVQVQELALALADFADAEVVAGGVDQLPLLHAPDATEVGLEHRFYLHFHANLLFYYFYLFLLL